MQNVYAIRTKTLCFDETKCNSIEEIDQETSASSASQFKEPGLKGKKCQE